MHSITRTDTHLVVTFGSTIDLEAITAAIHDVGRRPDYAQSNDIWVLGDAALFISHDDFKAINQVIEAGYPRGATRTKTAIVTTTGFNTVVANMWSNEAVNLPYQVRVFESLEDAERWVSR